MEASLGLLYHKYSLYEEILHNCRRISVLHRKNATKLEQQPRSHETYASRSHIGRVSYYRRGHQPRLSNKLKIDQTGRAFYLGVVYIHPLGQTRNGLEWCSTACRIYVPLAGVPFPSLISFSPRRPIDIICIPCRADPKRSRVVFNYVPYHHWRAYHSRL